MVCIGFSFKHDVRLSMVVADISYFRSFREIKTNNLKNTYTHIYIFIEHKFR